MQLSAFGAVNRTAQWTWRFATMAAVGLFLGAVSGVNADTLRVPQDYFTIQDAIDAAADDDVVLVAPGLYREAIDFLGKSIVVRSSAGAETTTIDASFLHQSVVSFRTGEDRDATLAGFTLTGGDGVRVIRGRQGGGILMSTPHPRSGTASFVRTASGSAPRPSAAGSR